MCIVVVHGAFLHNPELTFSSSSKGSSEVEAPHQAVCKVANDSYKGNTGSSNEQCCDQTCAAVTCPKDQKAGCNVYVSVKLLRASSSGAIGAEGLRREDTEGLQGLF